MVCPEKITILKFVQFCAEFCIDFQLFENLKSINNNYCVNMAINEMINAMNATIKDKKPTSKAPVFIIR